MSAIVCKNCDHHFKGNFCPECGQSAHVHKVNAVYFMHDIPHSVFHVDKGLLFTFRQLLTRPGKTLYEYLDGKRVNHYRPFAYVLMLSAISSVILHWNRLLIHYLQERHTGQVVQTTEGFFAKYQSVFIFLMIPLVTLITWVIFSRNKFNFWEHLLINTHLAAQLNVLLVLMQIFVLIKYLVTGSPHYESAYFLTLFMTGFMTYYAITFSDLMKIRERPRRLGLKMALMCLLLATLYAMGMALTGVARVA